MSIIETGKAMPYFCPACQAIPQVGYCRLAGCPTAPRAPASPAERQGTDPGKPNPDESAA